MRRQLYTDQLQKLIDALFMEDFNGACSHLHCTGSFLSITLDSASRLELACSRKDGLRPYRLRDDQVVLCSDHRRSLLEARHLMAHLVQASWWPATNREEAVQWWEECFDFIDGLPHLLRLATNRGNSTLTASEYLAMAADRPFHPFAHAKGELAALVLPMEAQDPCLPRLHWWAVHPDQLMTRQTAQPAALLLTGAELARLNDQLNSLAPGHVALPALPSEHVVLLSTTAGVNAVDLRFSSPAGQPTSSLRTLISGGDGYLHLKLSTSARTLGAIRSMPPRYLVNSDQAHRLLERILKQHTELSRTVALCDESHWWVVGREQDIISNPGLFACQLRYLPRAADTQQDHLITLSALGFAHIPVWQQLLGDDIEPWQAVKELTAQFIQTFLTLWCQGVMPECHGQNLLARYRGRRLSGFVLRDHDTLRICPTRLKQQELPLPDYQIDWTTPNSLVLGSDERLLAYFTTLGLQVTLYPIALAALNHSDRSETDFWNWVRVCLEEYAATLADEQLKQVLSESLLEAEVWPFKQLLTPLLNQQAASTGMPSAMGYIYNPLLTSRPNSFPAEQDLTQAQDHEAST
ncbi:IucA/IucC family protein [Marinobacter sp.]|uniref:IucA/IucC family protein n=1 Tax=Marinobacter sp. TaxID=50741 RepID=UPI002354410A|nr:IucA/IucC family protein [Marinobacter sp.]